MNETKLWELLTDMALDTAQRSYDERSRTHIVFCLEIGKFGTRGIGAFADDAFADFKTRVEIELNAASLEQLTLWYEKMNNPDASRVPVLAGLPIEVSGKKQIGLLTNKEVHDDLQAAATLAEVSQSQLASDLMERIYEKLNSDAFSISRVDIRNRLKNTYKQKSSVKDMQWGVRVPTRLFTKIALFAREFDVTIPEVCTYLITTGLQECKKDDRAEPLARTAAAAG